MKRIMLIGVLLLCTWAAHAQEANAHFIDSLAANYLARNHGLAFAIGINVNGKEQLFFYGETEKGNNQKPDAYSLFEIGQLTQVFTSVLFAQMSTGGEINPDLPISRFLPVDVPAPVYQEIVCEPVQPDDYRLEKGTGLNPRYTQYVCKPDRSSKPQPILLCYLGTHTSGLPRRPDNLKGHSKNPYAGYTKDNLYEFLRGFSLPQPIGYDFRYSDLNMALLGHIMELKAGRPYAELLDSVILSKLSMSDTRTSLSMAQQKRLLTGHNAKGKMTDHWNFDIMAPALGLHSDMADMMKLLAININSKPVELKDVFDYTHNPRIRFTSKEYGTIEAALGWLVSPLEKADIKYVWQEGITGGFSSFMGFVESSHTGVIILSNSAVPVSEMGEEILRTLNQDHSRF